MIAASLAVIAATLSAFGSLRIAELEEDARRPRPYPFIDVESRYGIVQLAVKNLGGGPAHDIRIKWMNPIKNSKGEPIGFTKVLGAPDIPMLLPGAMVSTLIDHSVALFDKEAVTHPGHQHPEYSGVISYSDAAGNDYSHPFSISLEQYRHQRVYTEEALRTHYDLQQIPRKLEAIERELRKIRDAIDGPTGKSIKH